MDNVKKDAFMGWGKKSVLREAWVLARLVAAFSPFEGLFQQDQF